jgi:hypothetical protein
MILYGRKTNETSFLHSHNIAMTFQSIERGNFRKSAYESDPNVIVASLSHAILHQLMISYILNETKKMKISRFPGLMIVWLYLHYIERAEKLYSGLHCI